MSKPLKTNKKESAKFKKNLEQQKKVDQTTMPIDELPLEELKEEMKDEKNKEKTKNRSSSEE
ncbi:hypothetical protein [Alkalihalobacillus pseudalcaliphilus]|uniref:hypothetical protein n=1 Tax=Alkalihalobacillus pseudalcaliphilus TaxID=79884 RepID=UPI00064D94ED|nr:hypothetical protein [Alkalihalobacillus pseudalcaliphilus]KMK75331.1 hypothetical protein AB990_18135 [Alkalihalobacillus pseudalcaliphilus]